MEWRRAKTILILTFFVLNLLLGYQLWINTNLADSLFERAEMREETLQKLRNKSIDLRAELPGDTPKLQEITVHFAPADIVSEPQPFDKAVTVEDIVKPRPPKAIVDKIPEFSSFAFDPALSSDGEFVFHQLYDKWPMFEVNLRLISEGDRITAYTKQFAEVEEHAEDEEQTVISAYKAVGMLADHVLSEGSVIEHIQLGFHGQVYNSSTQVLAPKWRVVLENGEIYYVHALSGAVEKKE